MDVFQDWLNRLAEELKLGQELSLDEKNHCFLLFDETMLVEIEYKPDSKTFQFKGNLGNISENKIKEIYPQLLESNLGWKETNGTTLGLQQYSEKVLLVQNIPMEACDYLHFNKYLETFVNTFEYWIKRLQDLQTESRPAKTKGDEIRV